MAEQITNAEILKVRRHECSNRGHSWDVIQSYSGPIALRCSNCGASHQVGDRQPESAQGEALLRRIANDPYGCVIPDLGVFDVRLDLDDAERAYLDTLRDADPT